MSVVAPGLRRYGWLRSDHSAGAAERGASSIPSSASNLSALWINAATRAPTIGAITYSQASVKLAVAIIGPREIAGLKFAPVKLPAIMMLRATVIPIAIGARLPALRAYAVVSTTMTRKKASTASITNSGCGGDRECRCAENDILRELRPAEAGGDAAEHRPQ